MEARLVALERLLAGQDARIAQQDARMAQQEAELTALRATRAADATAPEFPDAPAAQPAATKRRGRKGNGARSSRRTLLKLGGAAAAAGVAAVAASATELAYPGDARAAGITWQTGQVNADTETFVLSTAGFPSPDVLQVRMGTGSVYSPVATFSGATAGLAAYDATGGFSGFGAYGSSSAGRGVFGNADSGTGVFGLTTSGYGVYGLATGSVDNTRGVTGNSTSGTGVEGFGGLYGGAFTGGLAPLFLAPSGAPGAPSSALHHLGEVVVDSLGVLWVCVGDGTPGTWVRVATVPFKVPGGTISYLSTPIRLLDARTSPGAALVTRGPLAGNETYAFTVAGLGGSGIPAGAQGLIGNMTVLGPSGAGNLSLFPAPGPGPSVASMTFGTPGLFLANGVNVAIGMAGKIMIQNQSSGTTPLVLDAVAFVS
jgi:hypothetical protein